MNSSGPVPYSYREDNNGIVVEFHHREKKFYQLIRIKEITQPPMRNIQFVIDDLQEMYNERLAQYHSLRRSVQYSTPTGRPPRSELQKLRQAYQLLRQKRADQTVFVEAPDDYEISIEHYREEIARRYQSYHVLEQLRRNLHLDLEYVILPSKMGEETIIANIFCIEYGPLVAEERLMMGNEDLSCLSRLHGNIVSNPLTYFGVDKSGKLIATGRRDGVTQHQLYRDHLQELVELFQTSSKQALPDDIVSSFSDPSPGGFVFSSLDGKSYFLPAGGELLVVGNESSFADWFSVFHQSLKNSDLLYVGGSFHGDSSPVSDVTASLLEHLDHPPQNMATPTVGKVYEILDSVINPGHSTIPDFQEHLLALRAFDTEKYHEHSALSDILQSLKDQMAEKRFSRQNIWHLYHVLRSFVQSANQFRPSESQDHKDLLTLTNIEVDTDPALAMAVVLLLIEIQLINKEEKNSYEDTILTVVIDDLDVISLMTKDRSRKMILSYLEHRRVRLIYRVPSTHVLKLQLADDWKGQLYQLHLDVSNPEKQKLGRYSVLKYASTDEDVIVSTRRQDSDFRTESDFDPIVQYSSPATLIDVGFVISMVLIALAGFIALEVGGRIIRKLITRFKDRRATFYPLKSSRSRIKKTIITDVDELLDSAQPLFVNQDGFFFSEGGTQ